ncbi:uncharacterized protein J4E88_000025 [Alternaria novae-zelandiae]|uniref:uncharacterized protein n=1 Tax=Alternaria novae-zelandiae TaxID=430562 RepID=UPI0020C3CD7B|nr:uncharacterized protein J4E88_000025 [Alternaria novae-zelandiae]KAI4695855.1 hypothetical protein J4E88_000025 [Alternaria novae-zelandiae]
MTVFHSNCTLPPDGTGFVSSPNARGTLDILWSCLSILVLSTWSILHLNVPTQSTPSGKTQDYKRKAIRFLAKLKWMAVNVVAPEWALGKAWSDYRSVSTLEEAFDVFRKADEVPWSRAHTYFANMGGFAIRFTEETHQAEEELEPNASDPTYNDTTSTYLDAIALPTSPTRIPQMSPSHQSSSENPEIRANGLSPTSDEAEELGPRADDGENGESRKQELPVYMQRFFYSRSHRGLVSAKSLRRSIENSSRSIGIIDWTTNNTNIHTVEKALEIVTMEHFQTEWERNRFLRGYTSWFHNLHVLQGDLWILDAHQLLLARELGIIKTLPNLSKDEVDDKTKEDALVKVLALGQVIWFFIQMGTRLSYHIPTSQLEIVVFSFAICTALTYGLLLDKPKDASISVTVTAARYPTPEKMIRIAIAGPYTWGKYRRSIWIPNNAIHLESKRSMVGPMAKMNQGDVSIVRYSTERGI